MSIVISVIDKNKKFYIASDKRGKRNGVINDNYKKIYPLSKNCYFGMTGTYEAGLDILNLIKKIEWNDRIDLIKGSLLCFDSYCIDKKLQKMTMVIAGKDEEGFFILQRNINGGKMDVKISEGSKNIEYALNASDSIDELKKHLEDKIISGQAIRDSIIETIKYASTIDDSISEKYDLYEI